ncbi:MAG: nitrous oxide reductase accessory protein NosL [candidate division Zixibacteria bacterium]
MNKAFWGFILVLAVTSCQMKVEPVIEAGIDECENCTMIIQNVDQGAVAIDASEELHTFCSPVCLINEFDKLKNAGAMPSWQSYLFDHTDNTAIPAAGAFIVHGDFHTAMGYGLLAFGIREAADEFTREVSGEIVIWNDLRLNHEGPDVSVELSSDNIQQPDTYEAIRGEIVYVLYDNGSDSEETVTLSGYDFSITAHPKSTGNGSFIADKPGQGFAFQKSDGAILGMLFVGGDHTTEEAIYR